ncbi:MAG: nascent polypeptide-associated complex protein [Thermoproteota archaeon]
MFRFSPADIKRQLRRLGLKNVDVETVDSEEVLIRASDGRVLVLPSPQVVLIKLPGGAVMAQITAAELRQEQRGEEHGGQEVEVREEDVEFVAQQAGVSLEEAREALLEADGDIAAAILLIEERKRASKG